MKRRFELKAIYDYTKDHLLEWFPKLPSYQAFCYRLNRLAPAFQSLAGIWMNRISAMTGTEMTYVVDSCPVVLAKQRRSSRAKIAPELCDKGYNSSRDEYYYGVKLHTFAARYTGTLPKVCAMMISRASDHDLPVVRQIMDNCSPFRCGILYADKSYIDEDWAIALNWDYLVKIITPRKHKKNDFLRGGDAFSSFVSALRQQIESFFNWLNALTNIQSASKVCSSAGLLVHIFSKIAVAFFARYLYS